MLAILCTVRLLANMLFLDVCPKDRDDIPRKAHTRAAPPERFSACEAMAAVLPNLALGVRRAAVGAFSPLMKHQIVPAVVSAEIQVLRRISAWSFSQLYA